MRKKILLLLLFSNLLLVAQQKKNIDSQSLLWMRYYNQLMFNDKFSVHLEIDNRSFLDPIRQNLLATRIQTRYKINKNIETGIGFAYFSVSTQNPDLEVKFKIPEYRGQQDITLKQEFDKLNLGHRFQVEERFVAVSNKNVLSDKMDFFWRFRYKIQADYTIWGKEKKYFKTVIFDEIMLNAGKTITNNTFDQNRIYAGFQYGFNKSLAVELGYMNSVQQRASGIDYFDRNIIRLSVFHKIKL